MLGPGEVHLWQGPRTVAPAELVELTRMVSVRERERGDRFRFAADRDRFLVGRAKLRWLLGRYLDVDPAAVQLAEGEHGKPYLPDASRAGLEFNLSHSADVVVVAVARHRWVGVDVEQVRTDLDVDGLAKRLFSAAERSLLDRTPSQQRYEAFFTLWTRKEALLKAAGTGFAIPAEHVEAVPGRPARVFTDDLPTTWSVGGFATQPGYRAAVAVSPPGDPLPRRARSIDS
jgi:4'-phosphopantetheinyl transferase